jgi:hypothetical protein
MVPRVRAIPTKRRAYGPSCLRKITGVRYSELLFISRLTETRAVCLGLVKVLQKLSQASGNGFFQDIAVVVTKGITNPCSNGPTDVFLISWHNIHVRSPAQHGTLSSDLQYLNPLVSVFVPNAAAQNLCTLMRNHERRLFASQRNRRIEERRGPGNHPAAARLHLVNPEVS